MNVKVDINLAKLGKVLRSTKDGHMYLDIEDLVNKYGYVSNVNGEPHFSLSVLERKEKSQYGESHSVKVYDNQTKVRSFINAIRVSELVFDDKPQAAVQQKQKYQPDDIF